VTWSGIVATPLAPAALSVSFCRGILMGTTFVTLTAGTSGDEPGFWMRDGMLVPLWTLTR
jgi:hypothetical protein